MNFVDFQFLKPLPLKRIQNCIPGAFGYKTFKSLFPSTLFIQDTVRLLLIVKWNIQNRPGQPMYHKIGKEKTALPKAHLTNRQAAGAASIANNFVEIAKQFPFWVKLVLVLLQITFE